MPDISRKRDLYLQGDVACEHADFVALAAIAEEVLEHVDEPLHCELVGLARACADPDRAADAWSRLKERIEAPR